MVLFPALDYNRIVQIKQVFYVLIDLCRLGCNNGIPTIYICFKPILSLVLPPGMILSAFSVQLWQFYAATGLQFLYMAKYGLCRSLLSKCVPKDETGKMYSALGIIAAIVPIISNGVVRTIYNLTLDNFPAAEIIVTAGVLLLAACLNFLIYTQKWRIDAFISDEESKEDENNNESKPEFIEENTIIEGNTYL